MRAGTHVDFSPGREDDGAMRTLCIRFDIDTPTCLGEGVPRLLDMSARLDIRCTFFLSVGRAVSRSGALGRMITRSRARTPRATGFSSLHKLGAQRYARLALLNPWIGRSAPRLVERLAAEAEVGLHGGRNHDTWQNGAHTWSEARIADELDWALGWLGGRGIRPLGFSSPGWNDPPGLPALLAARGFIYRGDRHGSDLRGATEERPGFFNLATNLAGEPGGVAYIEHMRARGLTDAEIREAFRASLLDLGDDVVLYDHPYYAGLQAVPLLEDLVRVARDEGFRLVTMAEMATRRIGSRRHEGAGDARGS